MTLISASKFDGKLGTANIRRKPDEYLHLKSLRGEYLRSSVLVICIVFFAGLFTGFRKVFGSPMIPFSTLVQGSQDHLAGSGA